MARVQEKAPGVLTPTPRANKQTPKIPIISIYVRRDRDSRHVTAAVLLLPRVLRLDGSEGGKQPGFEVQQ